MKNSEILYKNFYFILQADKFVCSDQFKGFSELKRTNQTLLQKNPEIEEKFLLQVTDCLQNFYEKYNSGTFWNGIALNVYNNMKLDQIDGDDDEVYYKMLSERFNTLYNTYKQYNDEKVIYAALNILDKFHWTKEGA